jgi:hypothetical protein
VPILVGIDGTGGGAFPTEARNARYDRDFANSFVRRLCRTGNADIRYFRGPVTLGGGLVDAVNNGYEFVVARKAANPGAPVLLTGYSRGAAGAVAIAQRLQRASINVQAILLFDCVDRHVVIDAEVIPSNVGYVMHVVRDPKSESRESFSNDGLRYRPPTVYPAAYKFMCTHGGMGGTPWQRGATQLPADFIDEGFPDGMTKITFAQDERVSRDVWSFVQPFCRTHGFVSGGAS